MKFAALHRLAFGACGVQHRVGFGELWRRFVCIYVQSILEPTLPYCDTPAQCAFAMLKQSPSLYS